MSDDQDFFFDEEETVEEKPAPAAKSSGSKAPAKASAAPAAASTAAPAAQTVTMTVAALIGVVALLAGVIIGIVLPVGASDSVPEPTTTGTSATAPTLSDEELQSGTLPEGHPDISGMSSGTAESAPATTAP